MLADNAIERVSEEEVKKFQEVLHALSMDNCVHPWTLSPVP